MTLWETIMYVLIYVLMLCGSPTGYITNDLQGHIYLWHSDQYTKIIETYPKETPVVTEINLAYFIEGQCL